MSDQDPMYGVRTQIQESRSAAHEHDPRTCPECKDRAQRKHDEKEARQQSAPPRDRQVKAPRRNR